MDETPQGPGRSVAKCKLRPGDPGMDAAGCRSWGLGGCMQRSELWGGRGMGKGGGRGEVKGEKEEGKRGNGGRKEGMK